MTEQTLAKDVHKCGAMVSGDGPYHLATDRWYLADTSDEALMHMYELVHADFEKKAPLMANRRSQLDGMDYQPLQAELAMLREFRARGIKAPRMNDALADAFDNIVARVRKADEKTYKAVTQPDTLDEHVHSIEKMTRDGDGVTTEAGNPLHSHNVSGFMCLPVTIDGYESDHPGKVDVKVGKSAFQVTKREEDGGLEWTSDFELFKKDEEQRLVGGIVYEPDVIDAQNDSASPSEIQKACHNYMMKQTSMVGVMHEKMLQKREAIVVENFISPVDYLEGGQLVRKGSWVMVLKVVDDRLWSEVKEGKYTGFSMAGKAIDVSRSNSFGKRVVYDVAQLAKDLGYEMIQRIKKEGDKWCVYSKDGNAKLGTHDTKEAAADQLRSIENNKNLKPAKHVVESKFTKADYIDREQMGQLCKKCQLIMRRKHVTKVQMGTIMDRNKFKRVFGIRRSSKGHSGLCSKFSSDSKLFKSEDGVIRLTYNDIMKECKVCARDMRKRGINGATVAAYLEMHSHGRKK